MFSNNTDILTVGAIEVDVDELILAHVATRNESAEPLIDPLQLLLVVTGVLKQVRQLVCWYL